MSHRIRRLLPYLISLAFITPLIIFNNYIFPFIVPKIVVFRSLVLIIAGCYGVLLVSNFKKYRPRFSFLTISILLFWLSFAISTFAGVDWYHSFWDNHERMLGLFTITHYVILYLVASSVLETEREWNMVFRSALIGGALVMLIGVWQKFVDPQALLNNGSWRVSATLGNSIYYSGYGLFLMFLGGLQFFREQSKTWKYIALGVGLLGFLGIFLGGTRGAILGMLAGFVTLAFCYIVLDREKSKTRTLVTYFALAGVIVLALLFVFRQTAFVSEIPGLGRLLNTSFSLNSTESTRPMAWKTAIEAWKTKPLFGWGPNNFYYAFNEHYNPEFLKFGWNETWFDNAHSVIFNTLAVQGLLGISVYILIYIAACISLYVGVRRNLIRKQVGYISISFLVAHFVGLVTVFENPTSYLYFFVFLAFVAFSTHAVIFKKKQKEDVVAVAKNTTTSSHGNVSTGLVVMIGIIVLGMIYVTDIAPARANKATIAAIQKVYAGTGDARLYDDALEFSSPHLDDIRNDISRTVLSALPQLIQQGKNDQALVLFNKTIEELKKNQLLHPLDVRVHFVLSQLYEFGYQATQNKDFLTQSETELRRAVFLSPKRQQFLYTLAQNLITQGRLPEAEELLKRSINDFDSIGEGWVRLALVYAAQNKMPEAKETSEKVLGWYNNPSTTIYLLDPNWKPILEQVLGQISSTTK
ncbi:MAG TPA: O-antigen ligase family protein [Candidatus Magasanikbacteria bacterium]|nr:O-antigen ligase family protein [Candidatus Magasanikbacteria bacterium]